MDFDPNRPIWLQVMKALETDIVTKKRPPGDKLPGGRELALQYAINPNTAARVYQELERQGLCETRRGLGTFVTGDTERIAALRGELAQEAVQTFLTRMEVLGIPLKEASEMLWKREEENHA